MEKRHGWLHCAAVFIQCLSSAQGLRLFPVFCNCKQGAVNNPAHVSVPTLSEACPQGESPVARLGRKAHAHAALSHVAKSSKVAVPLCIPATTHNAGCLLTGSPTECVVTLFNFCESGRWETVPQSRFNLHFSNYGYGWTSFHMFKYHFYIFSGDCLFSSSSIPFLVFLPFVRLGILVLYLWYMSQQVSCLQTLLCCFFFSFFMVEVLLILGSTFITC